MDAFYFQAVDAGGYIQQSGQLQPGGSERELRFKISLPEGPARYEGSFAVRVCWDPACTDVLSTTGPIRYVFTREANDLVDASIGAVPQLTPLRALEGAADWTGARGNPANTGYVPVELDVSKFSLRWRWDLPPGKSGLLQQATMAGKVALAAGGPGSDNAHTELFVLNESDGTVGWRRAGSFSPQGYYGVPALSQTTLYSVVRLVDPMLVAYDLATGAQRFSFTVPSYSYDIPPVVVGNQLLMPRGTGGGVLSVEASSGRTWWRADPIAQSWSGAWAPASDGTTAFAYAANTGTLAGYSMTDGSVQLSITDDVLRAVSGGVSATRVVAVHQDRAFVVEDGALVAFDIVTKKPAWRQTTDDYVKGVAVQGGTLIALRQAPLRVEARHPKDGRLLWTTQPLFNLAQVTNPYGGNGVFMGDPVLTDNLVFVSTNSGVFALSRTTGSPLWFYGKGGTLAISSNGVLTVANPASSAALGGGVTAINLH